MGHGIPEHITGLPAEVMASPFGQMLLPQLRQMEGELNSRHQHSVRPQVLELCARALYNPLGLRTGCTRMLQVTQAVIGRADSLESILQH